MSWLRGYKRRWRWWRRSLLCMHPTYFYPSPMPFSIEEEIVALEDYKKYLEKEKASIEEEIKEVEARIRELKDMLEGVKK